MRQLRRRGKFPGYYNEEVEKSVLGAGHRAAGRTDDAITIHEETLEIIKRVLRPEHPDTLTSRNKLAGAYYEAGRTRDAARLEKKPKLV